MNDVRMLFTNFDAMFENITRKNEFEPESWHQQALCTQTDPEAFFPDKGGSTREAKRVCGSCEVRRQCLDYALAHDQRFGIWGGLSPRERRRYERGAA
ncbi:WhiB family transcriptional regulator [Nocardia sp. NPDC058058]|uniref:WhiB family transcriptional regulator n=1 Tax=Nocardia sp. NPDC058058 TaxID=3346317 RepID=UPI0036DB069A